MSDDDLATIRLERVGSVLVATIDRPGDDLNAVDAQLHHDLAELMRRLRRERDARAVVLTGSGRAFSAGGDFAWFPELRSVEALDRLRLDARQLVWDLVDLELPIVAALNGHAVGLGASIALLCDVVVMGRSAIVSDPHVRVGIVAGDGGTAIWPALLGPLRAKRYLLTGDPVDAATAVQLGLATEVVDDDAVLPAALRWADRLAAGAPLAIRATKASVNQQIKRVLLDSFELAAASELLTFLSADHREALDALQDRRPPRFEGR